MARPRASLLVGTVLAFGGAGLAGGCGEAERAPRGLPGMPPPFQAVAVVGSGGVTAAIDAYGNVVEMRAPGPAAKARERVGEVAGWSPVPRVKVGARTLPFWRADEVRQRYLPGTNVLLTIARFGDRVVRVARAIGGQPGPSDFDRRAAARADRRWLSRAQPLGEDAFAWANRLYRRSLLVLRATTDRRTGAVAAGIREGWAYIWPRDAGVVAIALSAAGYRAEAREIVRFLLRLDLAAAARFHGDRTPVAGRDAQGDAAGWVGAAARAAGLPVPDLRYAWRDRADYQEKEAGEYLGNAIAAGAIAIDGPKSGLYDRKSAHRREAARIERTFGDRGALMRETEDPSFGLDSAAAWAVRPFPQAALFPAVRKSLRRLIERRGGRFGIVPSEDWPDEDPWTASTAWSAWAFAGLAREERRAGRIAVANRDRATALKLMAALRRAATPLGLLPERVDAQTGAPLSTTPLAWSHAFLILTLRELWPRRAGG